MIKDTNQGKLPVFALEDADVGSAEAEDLARRAFDLPSYSGRSAGGRMSLRHGGRFVDVDVKTGAVWASDETRLWNPDLTPRLPDSEKARALGRTFFNERKLASAYQGRSGFAMVEGRGGATMMASYDARTKKRGQRQLDTQINLCLQVEIPGGGKVPVVGGGGKLSVTFGDAGEVIGFQNSCRPIGGLLRQSTVIPRAEADRQFKEMTRKLNVQSFDAYLAYQMSLVGGQPLLAPVWVYGGQLAFGKRRVPMRLVTLPATESGPFPPSPRPQRPRPRPAGGAEGRLAKPARRGSARARNPSEAGTSWIGLSGGLPGSQNNAQGFVDGLAADGWNVNFNWGDAFAFESDWRRNDDVWVDAADFVFYTGHANQDGWVLSRPDDDFLHFMEVGNAPGSAPRDLWGQQDLEWAVIAACGPLQDDLLAAGGGDVFARWDGAFDGLHQLLGYGAITFDNEEEGARLTRYCRDGQPIIDAWFRAAKEIQPSDNGFGAPDGPTVWVGAMYVYQAGTTSPRNDHIWGRGSVAPDPLAPNVYVAMWSTC